MEFWHLGAYKELNTCFIHFVNVGRLFGLLGDKELEPMMPLVELWIEKGWMPRPTSSAGSAGPSLAGSNQRREYTADGGRSDGVDRKDMGAGGGGAMGPPHGTSGSLGGQSATSG